MSEGLMARVGATWIYTPDRYASMAGLYRNEKINFMVKHSGVLHTAKSLAPFAADLLTLFGNIAKECEAADHDKDFQATNVWRERIKELVAKMYVNLASVSSVLEMSDDELKQRIDRILTLNN